MPQSKHLVEFLSLIFFFNLQMRFERLHCKLVIYDKTNFWGQMSLVMVIFLLLLFSFFAIVRWTVFHQWWRQLYFASPPGYRFWVTSTEVGQIFCRCMLYRLHLWRMWSVFSMPSPHVHSSVSPILTCCRDASVVCCGQFLIWRQWPVHVVSVGSRDHSCFHLDALFSSLPVGSSLKASFLLASSVSSQLDASLARESAFSLPYSPECDGIHWITTLWYSHKFWIDWEMPFSFPVLVPF